jgi:C-terminal processing protease CtpA/Prc
VRVALSSMASFQPDGRLYDGNGIEPDIIIEPTITDVLGTTDTTMDAAIAHIRGVRSDH